MMVTPLATTLSVTALVRIYSALIGAIRIEAPSFLHPSFEVAASLRDCIVATPRQIFLLAPSSSLTTPLCGSIAADAGPVTVPRVGPIAQPDRASDF